MCGIVGIVGTSAVGPRVYDALTVLQHRGQDAAGIATDDRGRFALRKDIGLVRDVFRQHHMEQLEGHMGLGHCRYPTAGCSSSSEAQPFYVNSPYGIALAHNGNLTNTSELVDDLFRTDLRHINTTSDSEVLLNVFAYELQRRVAVHGTSRCDPQDVFDSVKAVHQRCRGAYAFVVMIIGHGIVAVRDPHGIRPLVFGQREDLHGKETMFASESVALDALDFQLVRDVAPGEAVYADVHGRVFTEQCAERAVLSPCIFEHVYLARPDSFIDGISVYKARLRMGEKLAEKVMKLEPDHDIDVVMPIPDSGRTAALAMANRLGVKYREGFIKNRYIGRTFIMPGQALRKASVRKKLNPIDLEFRGKVVFLVDDSIVRGTTCEQIIRMARECGAKKVYYGSAAPPVRCPNVYGIDMPAKDELIAHGRSVDEVCKLIGADWLVYQDLGALVSACREGNSGIETFDCSVFDGRYVTGDIDAGYLEELQSARNDAAKSLKPATDEVVVKR